MSSSRLLNTKGFSLIEVMVVVGLMSFVGLGVATLMNNIASIQRRQELRPVLRQIKTEIEQAFRSQKAWENTVYHPDNSTSLGCLRAGTGPCTSGGTHTNIRLRNALDTMASADANNTDFDVIDNDNPSAGWTYNGVPCSSWTNQGNDACPISYQLSFQFDCGATANCKKPLVTLVGTLNYAPRERWSVENRVNGNNYRIEIRRGESTRFEPFEIRMEQTGAGVGGGDCSSISGDKRPLNLLVANRPGNDSVVFNDANDQFTLQPGRYSCEIVAEGYQAEDGFAVQLRTNPATTSIAVGTGFSPLGTSTYARGGVSLNVSTPTTYELWHICVDDASTPTSTSFHGGNEMGVPITYDASYPKVYASIKCVRSS